MKHSVQAGRHWPTKRGEPCAGGVVAARPELHQAGGGASPTPALQSLVVQPIAVLLARKLVESHHYLHSLPGGTCLAFGVFLDQRLLGALILGVGPKNAYALVAGAAPNDCLVLTRLWLSDELPRNSESRLLGIVLRSLRKHTQVKFLVSYADPAQGHVGTIYQAANWTYTGLSEAVPLYDIGDGKARHSRSLSHAYGTHSLKHFHQHGIAVEIVPQSPKHTYVALVDPSWRERLTRPVLPYIKAEDALEGE